jgi:hypothetical protein
VLRALLRQAASEPGTGDVSEHARNSWIKAGGGSEDVQAFNFDTEYEYILHGILRSGVKLRVMVDALDECDEPKKLLNILRDASKITPDGLELLVSSRHEVDVRNKFPDAVMVDLNQSSLNIYNEMTRYIETEVKDLENDERLLEGTYPDLEDRLVEILCKRAGGMYNKSLNSC